MKNIITISLIFLTVSCGSTQNKGKAIEIAGEIYNVNKSAAIIIAEEGNKERMVCTNEKTLGSHMAIRNCMSVSQRNKLRQKTKAMFRNAQDQQGRAYVHVITPGDDDI